MKKIGIIYSPGFGAGWSTRGEPEMALDQELAMTIESMDYEHVLKVAEKNWPAAYKGGLEDCKVEWVNEGTMFQIGEYDGNESIIFADEYTWMVAK